VGVKGDNRTNDVEKIRINLLKIRSSLLRKLLSEREMLEEHSRPGKGGGDHFHLTDPSGNKELYPA